MQLYNKKNNQTDAKTLFEIKIPKDLKLVKLIFRLYIPKNISKVLIDLQCESERMLKS